MEGIRWMVERSSGARGGEYYPGILVCGGREDGSFDGFDRSLTLGGLGGIWVG